MKAKPMRFAVALRVGSNLLSGRRHKTAGGPAHAFDLYSPNGAYNAEFPANCAYLWKLTNDSWSTDSDDSSTPTAKQ